MSHHADPDALLPRSMAMASRARMGHLLLGVLLAAAVLLTPRQAVSSETSALINDALDRNVNLELDGFLPDVMKRIEDRTSVPIRADPIVWELLPWGQQTRVTARIQNQPLRVSLGAITQKLGLRIRLAEEAVLLEPMPGLRRLGRRSTADELNSLDILASTPMPPVTDAGSVRSVLTAIDLKLDAMQAPLAIEDRLDVDTRGKILNLPRGATMLDALEQVVLQTRGTWYPWSKTIVVVTKDVQIRDQLAKTITMRYPDIHISQVLEDLRRRADVPFEIEAGALQKVPPDSRNIRIFWDNVPVEQALQELRGFAGIEFAVTDAGVRITHPGSGNAAVAMADPVVAMISLENGMTMLVRESQIPPELRQYLQQRLDKTLVDLRVLAERDRLSTGGPASQPSTTQPANTPAPGATQPATKGF